jgi:uncharacterized protein
MELKQILYPLKRWIQNKPVQVELQGTARRRGRLQLWLLLALLAALLPWPQKAQAQSAAECAQTVVVRAGDSLSALAARYLGNQLAYQRIVDATNAAARVDSRYARINNANSITVGWQLCIPGTAGAAVPLVAAPVTADPAVAEVLSALPDLPAMLNEREPLDGFHPLTIEYLRRTEYPSQSLVIEQTLTAGSNYSRYLVSYRSEGLKIYAYLTVPNGVKPATGWPVVIFNHGYIPPTVYRSTERYIAYTDAFARNGYIVLRPDYRGHGLSEGDARGGYGAPDYTIDVLNAVATIKQYGDADPNRLGMWGHSMGGYITVRAMVTNGDIKAGVIWAGVVGSYEDLLYNWGTRALPAAISASARRWRDRLLQEYGTPETNPEFWNSISANSFLNDLSGPVQLHHGTADTSVPVAFSDTLYRQIQEAGRVAEYYTYTGDDHNIGANLTTALNRSVAFFDTHVKNQ